MQMVDYTYGKMRDSFGVSIRPNESPNQWLVK